MHANRYIERDGKLFEIMERDPEKLREIDLQPRPAGHVPLAKILARELNEAEHRGRERLRYQFHVLMGIKR
jgi:hypothetical protein